MAVVWVQVFGVPVGACSPEKTWEAAADLLRRRLTSRFGDQVAVEYVELFSPASFQYPGVLEDLQEGRAQVPVILVDGATVPSEGKLPLSRVENAVLNRLQGRPAEGGTSV